MDVWFRDLGQTIKPLKSFPHIFNIPIFITILAIILKLKFQIEDLEQFAKARGLVVLNLDKFILSTDQRVPIYNCELINYFGKLEDF